MGTPTWDEPRKTPVYLLYTNKSTLQTKLRFTIGPVKYSTDVSMYDTSNVFNF